MDFELWRDRFTSHLQACGRRERTIGGYVAELRLFLVFLSERGLGSPHEIRREDVEAYQVSLYHRRKPDGRPLTLSTQASKMSAVLMFLRFLYRSQVLLRDPGREILLPRPPRRVLPELPTVDEVLRLLEVPDVETPLGLRDRAILELFYSSALRNSELRLLRLGDVDLARLTVRIRDGKGGHARVVPLGEPAAIWVERYLDRGRGFLLRDREHGFLFCSRRGRPLRVEPLSRMVDKYAQAAGLEKHVTPHILRHCCATHMLANQARLRHLQELLGHASAESTKVYTRVNFSDLREAHQRCHPRESLG